MKNQSSSSIVREATRYGVVYFDAFTGQQSRATYPDGETEGSAKHEGLFMVEEDELGLWPQWTPRTLSGLQ